MFTIVTSTLIYRPVEEVFAYYLNPANRAHRSDHVLSAEWLGDSSPGPGASFRVVLTHFGRTIETIRTITLFEPNRLICYETTVMGIHIKSCQTFRAHGDGTLFTIEADYHLPWYLRLGQGTFQRQQEVHLNQEAQDLKFALEETSQG